MKAGPELRPFGVLGGHLHRRGRPRQGDDVALRGEHEDLVGLQVEAQAVEELPRVGRLLLPVEDLAEPLHLLAAAARAESPLRAGGG